MEFLLQHDDHDHDYGDDGDDGDHGDDDGDHGDDDDDDDDDFFSFFFAANWHTGSLEQINVQNFRKFEGFFGKKLKKIDFNFENSEISFKITLLQSPFFRKKNFCLNFAHWYFKINKCAQFWNI